ncbi:MAG: hypothetical protein HZB91_07285 [Elusimicrobia bacterium]|nr:hypothetical protein [Elusimicrobiota bacterium]
MSFPLVLSGIHALALLAAAIAAATGSGFRLLRLLGVRDEGGQDAGRETVWAGTALGLGVLSLGTMALGVLGVLKIWSAAVLLAGLVLWGWPGLKAASAVLKGSDGPPLLILPIGLLGLALLGICLMPPHQYDSLVYHLSLPETYVLEGRLVSPPHLLYSHFPQNAEMLFTLALVLKSDVLAQMFMWLSTALCLGWVFDAARRELGEGPALLALGLCATHTALMLLATITYVEPLVMLWTCSAVLSSWRWWAGAGRPLPIGSGGGTPAPATPGAGRGWLWVSAVFSGLALGTKYTAGATAALLALVPVWRALRSGERSRAWSLGLRDCVLYSLVVSAVFLPWLIKNAVVIGNPVFPFLYSWFPMTGSGWGAETAQRYFRILAEYGHGESWVKDFVTLPYQLLVRYSRYGGGMDVLGCLGWSIVLTAGPLSLWPALKAARGDAAGLGRLKSFLRFLLIYCGIHFLVWFATGTVLRFLTAIAPLLALLAAGGLDRLWSSSGRAVRLCLAAVCVAMTAVNLGYFLFVHRVLETGRVLLGRESREAFLARRLDYYPCAAWCRERLAPNDKILIVGEQRAYYLGRDHVASTVNAPNQWVELANAASDPEDLSRRLRAEGYTKVLFVSSELARLFPAFGTLTEKGFANLRGLPGAQRRIFDGPRCGVFPL